MTKKPAKGVRGHLLYSQERDRFFFRVYEEGGDPLTSFTDYRLMVEDVMIEIIGPAYTALVDNGKGERMLTYDMETLKQRAAKAKEKS